MLMLTVESYEAQAEHPKSYTQLFSLQRKLSLIRRYFTAKIFYLLSTLQILPSQDLERNPISDIEISKNEEMFTMGKDKRQGLHPLAKARGFRPKAS
jgi:hypothetical protein